MFSGGGQNVTAFTEKDYEICVVLSPKRQKNFAVLEKEIFRARRAKVSDNVDKNLDEIIRINNIEPAKYPARTWQSHSIQGTPRHRQRGEVHRYSLSENERIRRKAKQKKRRMIRRWIIVGFAVVIFVLIIVLLCKGFTEGNAANADLTGVWHYDQYTEYEFDGNGNGCMCLDGNNHFKFTYKIEGDTLCLDFALEYVTDCQYGYTVEGNKLKLVGGEGTAEMGKVYELTKNLFE